MCQFLHIIGRILVSWGRWTRSHWKAHLIGLGGLIALYVGSYVPNSLAGGWIVNESGKHRFSMATADEWAWMPRYGKCSRFINIYGEHTVRAWGWGTFYMPLILLDQAYWHPTIPFLDDDWEFIDPLPAPPLEDFHPTRTHRFHDRFPYNPAQDDLVTDETPAEEP